jgi:hypothetical protein
VWGFLEAVFTMTKEELRAAHRELIGWLQARGLTLGQSVAITLSVASACIAKMADNDETKLEHELTTLTAIFCRAAEQAFAQERKHAEHC